MSPEEMIQEGFDSLPRQHIGALAKTIWCVGAEICRRLDKASYPPPGPSDNEPRYLDPKRTMIDPQCPAAYMELRHYPDRLDCICPKEGEPD